jgi:indole-3-glycerol phosphate synthase
MFHALSNSSTVALIAELKRRSPSKGVLDDSLDAVATTATYVRGGAVALSILTEPFEFGGSIDDLRELAAVTSTPLLKKDFHVADAQLYEARILGASAVLLIARALPTERLIHLCELARALDVEPLVEVRSARELDDALAAGARLIGVNARNLETLEVDPSVVTRLVPRIPGRCIAIAESGITSRADVEAVASSGADAILVGSVLSAAPDPEGAARQLCGVSRRPRGS